MTSGSRGKTLDPLCKKGVNLERNGNDGKTSEITGMEHDLAGDEIAFPTPEELEDDGVQFGKNPLRHVDQEATYHTLDKANALVTRAFPERERERDRQELRQLVTASMRGRQLTTSMGPLPKKTPRTLILTEVQRMGNREPTRPRQEPSHRPSHFPRFSFEPVPFSNFSYVSKAAAVALSEVEMTEVSSA
ncbi:hypothetical protein OS493_016796 [Desmophyllum pertusum]|uniref:Uncharacterized protein n=1 Tax=Desmophyllum pertusum TaxID=174260 RepID=A0A9X0CRD6_9CNID|nr:hypothetical protein OS493_016796 [Desmophyllum pertusum]